MFTRCSDWTTDKSTSKLSARYMIANNIKAGGVECIQIKEFIVNLDFQDINQIGIKPMQIKFISFNEEYINSIKSS